MEGHTLPRLDRGRFDQYTKHCMARMDFEAIQIIPPESPDCNIVIVTQNEARVAREQARSVDVNGFVINLI